MSRSASTRVFPEYEAVAEKKTSKTKNNKYPDSSDYLQDGSFEYSQDETFNHEDNNHFGQESEESKGNGEYGKSGEKGERGESGIRGKSGENKKSEEIHGGYGSEYLHKTESASIVKSSQPSLPSSGVYSYFVDEGDVGRSSKKMPYDMFNKMIARAKTSSSNGVSSKPFNRKSTKTNFSNRNRNMVVNSPDGNRRPCRYGCHGLGQLPAKLLLRSGCPSVCRYGLSRSFPQPNPKQKYSSPCPPVCRQQ